MGRDRYRVGDPAAPYFLTCTALLWLPLFAQPANARILLDSLQYLQTQGGLTLYGYVILENHCHLLGCSAARAISARPWQASSPTPPLRSSSG
jgi:hypothetical protein